MAFDLKKWLTEDMGFSTTDALDLEAKFTGDRLAKLEAGYLGSSELAQQRAAISKTQADLDQKNTQLNTEMAEWAEIKGKDSAEAKELKAALDQTRAEAFELTQRLTRLAEEAGVDPTTVLPKKGDVVPPKKDDPKPFDPSPLMQQMSGALDYVLTLQAELPAIAAEHLELTGERLDTRKFMADLKARAAKKENIDPVSYWEASYGIPEKRAEKSKLQREAEIKAAEDRGAERARSELAIPGQQAPGSHAPVFQGDRTSKITRPQAGATTRGYAQSIASGKYRQARLGQKSA